MPFDPSVLVDSFVNFPLIRNLWWLWSFLILFFLARALWLSYAQLYYKYISNSWTLFELRIPRELKKSPRAMEQIFYSMHGVRNAPNNLHEKYWDGEVTLWFSCEISSFGGELHMYLRTPTKHRNMIEAALYAQYPDIEVAEVEDYTNRMPSTIDELKRRGYELFGNELVLAKHDAYPIRTFVDFEEVVEERQLDPVATILETMSKIRPQEIMWVQILVRPRDESWKKSGDKLLQKVKEETGKQRVETATGAFVWTERTPGELERMKAIDRNISKPGFDTIIRYIYIAPREMLDMGFARRGIFSAFNQYASESLNKFKHNVRVWTRVNMWYWPHIFPKSRLYSRQKRIYANYRIRKIYDESFVDKALKFHFFHWGFTDESRRYVLNTEELATIFHLPTNVVLTGPLIKRVEARKIGPPAGLSIFGEEGEKLPGVK